jgi:hypothetical protein
MIRYYAWAVAEKSLSLVPGGKPLYRGIGRVVQHRTQGTGAQLANSFPLARKAKELVASRKTILDLGTGWFHHDAFLLYLVGDWNIVLFDVEDRGRLAYIRNYLKYLKSNIRHVATELGIEQSLAEGKVDELLGLSSREAIYERCGFSLRVTPDVTAPFLPERSVDFMVSNCVLVHIRPEILVDELVALRRMLTDDGAMYHMLGHDDHWAFHDPKVPWPSFNYLRYSERTHRLLFDTKLEYQNRLVKPEWLRVFDRAGLNVAEYNERISDESRAHVRSLPRIHQRYAKYSIDELAIYYSYILLNKLHPDGDIAER